MKMKKMVSVDSVYRLAHRKTWFPKFAETFCFAGASAAEKQNTLFYSCFRLFLFYLTLSHMRATPNGH